MYSFERRPIPTWTLEDRPREKLMTRGISALTDAELLAILIGTGTRDRSAVDLSREMLDSCGGLDKIARYSIEDLTAFRGIGEAKAISIVAAFELARRKQLVENQDFEAHSAEDVAAYLMPRLSDQSQEVFYVLYFNRKNRLLGERQIALGGVHATAVDPKVLFKEALRLLASAFIVSHNHPSGNLRPSQADLDLTRRLKEAGSMLEIQLLDHIIIAGNRYFSFASENLL